MAGIAKKGLDSFPFDTNLFQDLKIRKLIKYQSAKAIAVYTYLLCLIYRDGYYIKWDKELPFIISEVLGFDEAFVGEVIECCVRLGLFNEAMYRQKQVLTARGIQERYQQTLSKLRRVDAISEYSLLDSPFVNEMLSSPLWMMQMKAENELDDEGLRDAINEWSKEVSARDKQHSSLQDAKRHFRNWIKKVNNNNNNINNEHNGNKRKNSKPNLCVSAKASDYSTTL